MIGINNMDKAGFYIPEGNDEANGEIMGRSNALHDWLAYQASGFLGNDLRTVCVLMGFKDVIRYADRKEKADAGNAD